MGSRMPLLIVIPVRNEERRLGPGLARLAESLQAHQCPDVLIVVSDNGSTDGTRAVAIESAAKSPYRVVYHRATDGADKGVAIFSAWESAPEGYDVLAYCDTDMATDPEALVCGYRLIAEGKADLYPRFGTTNEWDTAAGHAILNAAGGTVVTREGGELGYAKPTFKNPGYIAYGRT